MISQSDMSRILLSRSAAVVFGVGTVLTVWTIVFHYWNFDFQHMSQAQLNLLSWGGAIGALGAGALLLGMWLFWGTCDSPSKNSHKIWFFILLIGGALPYYFLVYLPAFKRQMHSND